VTDKIKTLLKRRAVVEPIIGHAKNDGLLGPQLVGKGPAAGDRSNALLGGRRVFNLRQLLRFLRSIPYFLREFFFAHPDHTTPGQNPRCLNSNSK